MDKDELREKIAIILISEPDFQTKIDTILSLLDSAPSGLQAQRNLIEKLDEYIAFLFKANNGPISIAYIHGWRCPQTDIEKGERLRKEIEELRERITVKEG